MVEEIALIVLSAVIGTLTGAVWRRWWTLGAIGLGWIVLVVCFFAADTAYGNDGAIDSVLVLAAALPVALTGATITRGRLAHRA